MELNCTKLVQDLHNGHTTRDTFSASVAERGPSAGQLTWNAAKDNASKYFPKLTKEQRQEIRDHFRDYGAWEDSEINKWTTKELAALIIQEIASEWHTFENWEDSEAPDDYDGELTSDQWQVIFENQGGRLYPGDIDPDHAANIFSDQVQWFYYVGN